MVQQLLQLIRLRNGHPAFGGQFTLQDSSDQVLAMHWQHAGASATLRVDLAALRADIRLRDGLADTALVLQGGADCNRSAPTPESAVV